MSTATQSDKVLYTAKLHTVGGREGAARSSDGRLDVKFSAPGGPVAGTNPEQLFAAGFSACYEGAMFHVARQMKITLPPETAIDAEVDLLNGETGYSIRVRFSVTLPGLARDVAQSLLDAAEKVCPYSKAIHGNVPVAITLL
jgi:Ohr subfamily peroxiredoxin